MATTPDPSTRKVSSGRPKPSTTTAGPTTPTLQRSLSGFYGSPGTSLRSDEFECVVLELGSRFLRAGVAGEPAPRCTLHFGPNEQRRVGDYRQWSPAYENARRKRKREEDWGRDHELWRMDLREVDLGLVEDKLERAVRQAINKYLLSDPRPKKFVLAMPPTIPRQLLSATLTTLFQSFQAPNVTVLSSPVLSTVAAGARSGLVVDIGWAETTVTAVYEYREVSQRKSVRATKMLGEELGKMLTEKCHESNVLSSHENISFEEAEDILVRMGWCLSREQAASNNSIHDDKTISIPLADAEQTILELPFSLLSAPAESALFARGTSAHEQDEHELPLDRLIYTSLLALSSDVRQICISRIIFTGGGSNLPGIKGRLLSCLTHDVNERGWNPVRNYGSAPAPAKSTVANVGVTQEDLLADIQKVPGYIPPPMLEAAEDDDESSRIPAGLLRPEEDHILARLKAQNNKHQKPVTQGVVRGIETLGAWAGASLVAGLRIRGVVEVEKEKFLMHGLAGATTGKEGSVESAPQRQSLGPGVRPGAGERSSWSLGIWA